ncbi:WXG100 family type VII secretion target [Pseudonocardia sp. HH130630-07]|uniref:WXG100 family type VII secretion target n=1 Tax=Pseudonocardia sp. HH130630-07 TaxID=1690815 RepID=UPI0012EA3CFB|nr:WXG100 family type VII secretion target [Pseudonocardia sp. HH130630-07]
MSKIVYKYDELSNVDVVCRNLVNETNDAVKALRDQMNNLVGNGGWEGDTANSYDAKVTELGSKLNDYGSQLELVDNKFVKGNEDMQETDKRGGGKVGGV